MAACKMEFTHENIHLCIITAHQMQFGMDIVCNVYRKLINLNSSFNFIFSKKRTNKTRHDIKSGSIRYYLRLIDHFLGQYIGHHSRMNNVLRRCP